MQTREQLVDEVMQEIPSQWRRRWCGGEAGPCACLGCVQIGNRRVMAERMLREGSAAAFAQAADLARCALDDPKSFMLEVD